MISVRMLSNRLIRLSGRTEQLKIVNANINQSTLNQSNGKSAKEFKQNRDS